MISQGFSKRKHDKSESGCESVGDNFEMEYKPITNKKMASSDRCSFARVWDVEKKLEILVTNYYRILVEESFINAGDTIKKLKKSFTGPYTTRLLRDKLKHMRTLYVNKDDQGYCGILFQRFKEKYENCSFWETYLDMVRHPCFPEFNTSTGGSRSRTSSGRGLSAGPSLVNLNMDLTDIAFDTLERLNLEDKDLFYDAAFKLVDEKFQRIFMQLRDDTERREFLYHNFRKKIQEEEEPRGRGSKQRQLHTKE